MGIPFPPSTIQKRYSLQALEQEQLDNIHEIKDEWRELQDSLLNSGGHIISVKKVAPTSVSMANSPSTATTTADEDDLLNHAGSKSSSSYDRPSVTWRISSCAIDSGGSTLMRIQFSYATGKSYGVGRVYSRTAGRGWRIITLLCYV